MMSKFRPNLVFVSMHAAHTTVQVSSIHLAQRHQRGPNRYLVDDTKQLNNAVGKNLALGRERARRRVLHVYGTICVCTRYADIARRLITQQRLI